MEQLTNKNDINEKNIRYLIKYTKESNIKFISHLDLMRTAQKIVRRSCLPVKYSKGFNPHMAMSIAQPLSVGVYSSGEYMDLVFIEEVNEEIIIQKLNECSASGIKFLSAKRIYSYENEKKLPQAMALIEACRYTIKITYDNKENLNQEMKKLLETSEWKTIKKTKKSEREVDIHPFVLENKYWIKDNVLVLNVLLKSGSREHLSAELFVEYIKNHTSNASCHFVDIKREEMYYDNAGRLEAIYLVETKKKA